MMKDKRDFNENAVKRLAEEKTLEDQAAEEKRAAFFKAVEDSQDLNDQLQDLVDHVAENTGATAVYIGKVNRPIRGLRDGLGEGEDDQAHLIKGSKQ